MAKPKSKKEVPKNSPQSDVTNKDVTQDGCSIAPHYDTTKESLTADTNTEVSKALLPDSLQTDSPPEH